MCARQIDQPTLADIREEDYADWHRLWLANNQGVDNPEVTAETWSRLLSPIFPVHGMIARLDGQVAGLVHYILHPVTGHINPACYMQDLFTDPAFRRRGIGRALVEHLAAIGRREQWARLYWLADNKNKEAQALYKNLGVRLDFSFHVLPLS